MADADGRVDGGVDAATTQDPLRVSILRHGGHLVASIHTALDDGQLLRFRRELLDEIGRSRARGVIVDVAALDVIDSFACHTLRALAQVARLRGAETVVVGIQPDVAMAMACLGSSLHPVHTALDLEEGLGLLDRTDPAARGDDPAW
jgi:rsbT antagonist protein RsbS